MPASVDLDRLLRFRLVIGRFGEMDAARWWNTMGILGPRGATVLGRGMPVTHYFAQARIAFEVARARCNELFSPPPGGVTLWALPAELEDEFEERWQIWLGQLAEWQSVFEAIGKDDGTDLKASLMAADLVSAPQLELGGRLRRSADGRAVLIPGRASVDDDLITLLAVAFGRGEPGRLAVPYALLDQSA